MAESDNRISILEESEIDELYGVPQFTDAQRDHFFDLDEAEKSLISPRNDPVTNAYRILLLGYFKCKPVVLNPTVAEVKDDLIYIRNKYRIPIKLTDAELSPTQKSRIYCTLLNFCGCEAFNEERHQLTDFVIQLARQIIEPRAIFDGCIHHLVARKVAIPAYSTLQKIISAGIRHEEKAIEEKLLARLTDQEVDALRKMASTEEKNPLITRIKKLPKTFQQKEIYAEVDVLNKLQDIFPRIRGTVESLGLSKKNIEHLGKQVTYYTVSRLQELSKGKFTLYLTCFLYQRYFQIMDIIIQGFLFHVRKLVDEAQAYAKEKHHGEMQNMEDKIKKASSLLNIYVDDKVKDDIAFSVVRQKAFKILPKDEIPGISNFMAEIKTDLKKYQWKYYEEKQARIKNILRKLFLCLAFDSQDETAQPWLRQVRLSRQELMDTGKMHTFDARLIKPELRPHLTCGPDAESSGVNMVRAEMLLYIRIKDRIEDLKFYVGESLSYKWYEDDFIPAERVPQLISLCNLTTLKKPVKALLAEKAAILEQKRKEVGARIAAGENNAVVFIDNNGKKKWSIKRNAKESDKSESFYRKLRQIHIGDVIAHVERDTQFSKALTHRRLRKAAIDLNTIIACIVANGTRYGTHQMATLCGLTYDDLREAEKNYLRGETVHRANDLVSNAIAKLDIFKYYNIQEDLLHASYDGQRLESRFNTLSTHFSSKYFGRGKGLSAVSLIANHVPVNADIMKPYSHESHYLFDVLHGNTSDIQPDVVSTDTHGTNQFNFAILDCFGWSFAPRYARPGKVLLSLFDFVQHDTGGEIVLLKPINYKLIEENWDFIQQIMMSLDSREASQANIVRKMSRFKAKSNPFKALAEYDRLIKCIYLLDFIDDSTFRGYVQRALNRGESYHMLQRRIEQVNGSKFRGHSDDEISLWYECSRLIANCVIYFNSRILSFLLQRYQRENQVQKLEELKRCSPVAWTHINFNGSYRFSFDGERLDINQLLQEILAG